MKSRLILLDKPSGPSSARALYPVKREYGTGKIGHTGTLDPFASGLLVLLVGGATRLARWFSGLPKSYVATIQFGAETDTLDPEGVVVHTATSPRTAALEQVLPRFLGEIEQQPPAYSALKVGGKRAYELARAGREVNLASRTVSITGLELLNVETDGDTVDKAEISVSCGSGTYIRALARDIAKAAGSRGYLVGLRRSSVGPFEVSECAVPWTAISVGEAFDRLNIGPRLGVDDRTREALTQGRQPVPVTLSDAATVEISDGRSDHILVEHGDPPEPVALLRRTGDALSYEAVFPA